MSEGIAKMLLTNRLACFVGGLKANYLYVYLFNMLSMYLTCTGRDCMTKLLVMFDDLEVN